MILGQLDIIVILLILLILFGPRRVPQFARSIGQVVHKYRKGLNESPKKKHTK